MICISYKPHIYNRINILQELGTISLKKITCCWTFIFGIVKCILHKNLLTTQACFRNVNILTIASHGVLDLRFFGNIINTAINHEPIQIYCACSQIKKENKRQVIFQKRPIMNVWDWNFRLWINHELGPV